MDLTEIMDFLDSLEDSNDKSTSNNDDRRTACQDLCSDKNGLLKTPKRCRANTWHGDGSVNEDNTIAINSLSPFETVNNSPSNGTPPKGNLGHAIVSRKSIARRNAWGNLSYADMITQAINSTAEKRMTLSEIYNWMVQNIPFFRDKGESNSSAGWKNSIRHNLSLHNCFMRVQNDGAGKSSWWMLNPEYRVTRPQRRRAATMDLPNSPTLPVRRLKGAAKKAEHNSPSLADSTTNDTPIKEEMDSCEELSTIRDFRPRSKTINSKFSKLSPTIELEDPVENEHMKKKIFERKNISKVFSNERKDKKNDSYPGKESSFQRQSNLPSHPNCPFIKIPSPNSHSELKCGSLPAGWNYRPNNNNYPVNNHFHSQNFTNVHSMNNIRGRLYAENSIGHNNGSRLLSGGNVVRGHMFRRPFYNRHMDTPNNNNTYLKKCMMEDNNEANPATTKSLQMLMSGGLQVASANSWPPNYQQEHQHPFNNEHALLMHLLTDKEQVSPHSLPDQPHHPEPITFQKVPNRRQFNSPQHPPYPSMLQHLLTAGSKRSPNNQTYTTPHYSPQPDNDGGHQQYVDPSNNTNFQFSQQYPPLPSLELLPPNDFNNPSMAYPSIHQFRTPHPINTSPSKTYSDDTTLADNNNIDTHNTSNNYLRTERSKTSTTSSEIPEDLASLDSLFSSEIDAGFDSPSNIEMSISHVINLEKSLGDPFDLDLMTDAFNFP